MVFCYLSFECLKFFFQIFHKEQTVGKLIFDKENVFFTMDSFPYVATIKNLSRLEGN